MTHVQIFLSTVSAEFRSYRDALRRDLGRPNVTVKVQEDFIATGTETLEIDDRQRKERSHGREDLPDDLLNHPVE